MTSRWVRDPMVLWRQSGERIILLPPGSEEVMVLGGSGRHAWDLLAEPIPSADLAAALATLYGEDVRTVEQELQPFLDALEMVGAAARIQ